MPILAIEYDCIGAEHPSTKSSMEVAHDTGHIRMITKRMGPAHDWPTTASIFRQEKPREIRGRSPTEGAAAANTARIVRDRTAYLLEIAWNVCRMVSLMRSSQRHSLNGIYFSFLLVSRKPTYSPNSYIVSHAFVLTRLHGGLVDAIHDGFVTLHDTGKAWIRLTVVVVVALSTTGTVVLSDVQM